MSLPIHATLIDQSSSRNALWFTEDKLSKSNGINPHVMDDAPRAWSPEPIDVAIIVGEIHLKKLRLSQIPRIE